jgi:hypothetical protein
MLEGGATVTVFVARKDNMKAADGHIDKNHHDEYEAYKPNKRARAEPQSATATPGKDYFASFRAVQPARSSELPPAAERPATAEPQAPHWFNSINIGLLAGSLIDSLSSLLAPPQSTASARSSPMPPPPSARDRAAAAAVDRLAAAVAEKVAALNLADSGEEQPVPSLTERALRQCVTPAEIAEVCQFEYLEREHLLQCRCCHLHVNCQASDRIPGKLISGHNVNTFGVFKADQELRYLRKAAKEHRLSRAHEWSVQAEYEKQEQRRRQGDVGLNVARIAYVHQRVRAHRSAQVQAREPCGRPLAG